MQFKLSEDWIYLAHDKALWPAVMNMEMAFSCFVKDGTAFDYMNE
jgi:hypothetical protein